MNGELTKNTFTPKAPYTADSTNASFGDVGFFNAQSTKDAQNTRIDPESDPMQLSLFGDDVLGGVGAPPEGGILPGGGEIPGGGNEAHGIAGALPVPSDSEASDVRQTPGDMAADVRARSGGGRRKKGAAILTAFFCLSSVAAYICAGFFVTDTVMERGLSLFENELLAAVPAVTGDSDDTAIIIPAAKPAESEPSDTQVPSDVTSYPVEGVSMAAHDPFSVANETKYTPDIAALTSAEAFAGAKPSAVPDAGGEPLVLVVHTHATESFLDEGITSYNDSTSFRSTDPEQNMIAVGEELCRALGDAGIEALHCTEMFDKESFIHSYEKSAAAVSEYLRQHPSIRYVLDVHRDAIFRQDSTLLAARSADGAAQVMLVCGSDEMGADFPDWQDNLAFAFSLQAAAKAVYPDLMRNVNLRSASFNEQLAERFLLVEVGSAGNTLGEAKAAARRFAEVFASVVNG